MSSPEYQWRWTFVLRTKTKPEMKQSNLTKCMTTRVPSSVYFQSFNLWFSVPHFVRVWQAYMQPSHGYLIWRITVQYFDALQGQMICLFMFMLNLNLCSKRVSGCETLRWMKCIQVFVGNVYDKTFTVYTVVYQKHTHSQCILVLLCSHALNQGRISLWANYINVRAPSTFLIGLHSLFTSFSPITARAASP